MPPTLYLTLSSAAIAEAEKRARFRVRVNDLVGWNGRLYFVRGFDPMSVNTPRAFLEDAETREPRTIVLDDLIETHGTPATAA
jgi:hypothetical protein